MMRTPLYFCVTALLTSIASPALAYNYPVEIDITSQREIWELFYAEDIDDVDRDRLLDLWDRGVPINSADRNEFYELPGVTRALARKLVTVRKNRGGYKSVSELATVLPAEVYAESEAFLRFDESFDLLRELDVTTRSRLMIVTSDAKSGFASSLVDDQELELEQPGSALVQRSSSVLSADVSTSKGWQAGISVLSRQLVDTYQVRESDDVIESPGFERVLDLEKAYVRGSGELWEVVLGSHYVGFGLGLTIKDVSKRRLRGIYLPRPARPSDNGGLGDVGAPIGVAAMGRVKEAGPGWLTAHAFASHTTRDLYQYRFQSNTTVSTVSVDEEGNPKKLASATFRDAYTATRVGGALTYSLAKNRLFGITGWTAEAEFEDSLPGRVFAQSSPQPPFGRHSAGGVFTTWEFDSMELNAEGSFAVAKCDERKLAWGGPPAAACAADEDISDLGIVGSLLLEPTSTVDITLDSWYYGPRYLNPQGSAPQASAQQRLGNRNRNQTGGRIRTKYKPSADLELRVEAAVWTLLEPHIETLLSSDEVSGLPAGVSAPSCARSNKSGEPRELAPRCQDITDMKLSGQATQRLTGEERITVKIDFSDQSLEHTGRQQTYGGDHGGSRIQGHLRLKSTRIPRTKLEVGLRHSWVDRDLFGCADPVDTEDGPRCETPSDNLLALDEFDTDLTMFGKVRIDMTPGPKLVLTGRFQDELRSDSFDFLGRFKTGPQRGRTKFTGSVTLDQKFGKRTKVRLVWKMQTLLDEGKTAPGATSITKNRLDTVQSARLVLDVKF